MFSDDKGDSLPLLSNTSESGEEIPIPVTTEESEGAPNGPIDEATEEVSSACRWSFFAALSAVFFAVVLGFTLSIPPVAIFMCMLFSVFLSLSLHDIGVCAHSENNKIGGLWITLHQALLVEKRFLKPDDFFSCRWCRTIFRCSANCGSPGHPQGFPDIHIGFCRMGGAVHVFRTRIDMEFRDRAIPHYPRRDSNMPSAETFLFVHSWRHVRRDSAAKEVG